MLYYISDLVQYHIVSSTYFQIGLEVGKLTALNGGYLVVEENLVTGKQLNALTDKGAVYFYLILQLCSALIALQLDTNVISN